MNTQQSTSTKALIQHTVCRALEMRIRNRWSLPMWECAVECACAARPGAGILKLHLISRLVERRMRCRKQDWGKRLPR